MKKSNYIYSATSLDLPNCRTRAFVYKLYLCFLGRLKGFLRTVDDTYQHEL